MNARPEGDEAQRAGPWAASPAGSGVAPRQAAAVHWPRTCIDPYLIMFVEMAVHALAVSTGGGPCAILLRGVRLPVMLPIAIAAQQAAAIAAVRFQFRRPLTHDLMLSVLGELRANVERVVIHDVNGSTFIARLEMTKEGAERQLDCRPSDAIALAVRLDVPILVTGDVLARAEGVRWEKPEDGDALAEGGAAGAVTMTSRPDDTTAEPDKPKEPAVSPEQLEPFRAVIETLDLENL